MRLAISGDQPTQAMEESKRYSPEDGGWEVTLDQGSTLRWEAARAGQAHPVVETSAEQPWAEFCSGLDKPAFLLPVSGFAEL